MFVERSSGLGIGAIVGIALGGTMIILFVVLIFLVACKRRRKRRRPGDRIVTSRSADISTISCRGGATAADTLHRHASMLQTLRQSGQVNLPPYCIPPRQADELADVVEEESRTDAADLQGSEGDTIIADDPPPPYDSVMKDGEPDEADQRRKCLHESAIGSVNIADRMLHSGALTLRGRRSYPSLARTNVRLSFPPLLGVDDQKRDQDSLHFLSSDNDRSQMSGGGGITTDDEHIYEDPLTLLHSLSHSEFRSAKPPDHVIYPISQATFANGVSAFNPFRRPRDGICSAASPVGPQVPSNHQMECYHDDRRLAYHPTGPVSSQRVGKIRLGTTALHSRSDGRGSSDRWCSSELHSPLSPAPQPLGSQASFSPLSAMQDCTEPPLDAPGRSNQSKRTSSMASVIPRSLSGEDYRVVPNRRSHESTLQAKMNAAASARGFQQSFGTLREHPRSKKRSRLKVDNAAFTMYGTVGRKERARRDETDVYPECQRSVLYDHGPSILYHQAPGALHEYGQIPSVEGSRSSFQPRNSESHPSYVSRSISSQECMLDPSAGYRDGLYRGRPSELNESAGNTSTAPLVAERLDDSQRDNIEYLNPTCV